MCSQTSCNLNFFLTVSSPRNTVGQQQTILLFSFPAPVSFPKTAKKLHAQLIRLLRRQCQREAMLSTGEISNGPVLCVCVCVCVCVCGLLKFCQCMIFNERGWKTQANAKSLHLSGNKPPAGAFQGKLRPKCWLQSVR